MKNKILAISIILILLSSIFINNNVFAAETTYNLSDAFNYIPMNNGEPYPYVIYKDSSGNIWLSVCTSIEATRARFKSYFSFRNESGSKYSSKFYLFNEESSLFSYQYDKSGDVIEMYSATFIASSVNVYNGDNLFFQKTPLVLTEPTLSLAEHLEKINPIQVWTTQMKNVVVSLAVFFIGLIAFFKAWAWLKTQLRKA